MLCKVRDRISSDHWDWRGPADIMKLKLTFLKPGSAHTALLGLMSRCVSSVSKGAGSITTLGNLFQCVIPLTIKNCFLMLKWYFLLFISVCAHCLVTGHCWKGSGFIHIFHVYKWTFSGPLQCFHTSPLLGSPAEDTAFLMGWVEGKNHLPCLARTWSTSHFPLLYLMSSWLYLQLTGSIWRQCNPLDYQPGFPHLYHLQRVHSVPSSR